MNRKLNNILDKYNDFDFVKVDGFDDAIIDVEENTMRLVYSISKCVDIIMAEEGMYEEEALNFFDDEYRNKYLGDLTPIWVNDTF
jgi:hypothetical protein